MSDKPLLREIYDRLAAELGPQLTEATGSERFADVVAVVEAVRSRAAVDLERSSRRVLHAWNLPAGSDITVLRQEIGALDREVRALTREVEELRRELAAEREATGRATAARDRRAS